MISKKAFVSIMEAIETQAKLDDKHGDILTQLADPEFQYHKVVFTTPLIDSLLKALVEELELPEEKYIGNEISYFVFELGFGHNDLAKNGVTRKDGSPVRLTTPAELYDWIMEQRNERHIDPKEKITTGIDMAQASGDKSTITIIDRGSSGVGDVELNIAAITAAQASQNIGRLML